MQWGNETGPRAHVNISYEYLKQENRKKKKKKRTRETNRDKMKGIPMRD